MVRRARRVWLFIAGLAVVTGLAWARVIVDFPQAAMPILFPGWRWPRRWSAPRY